MISRARNLTFWGVIATCVFPSITAADADPLFAENSVLNVRIVAPLKQIMTDRPTDDDGDNDNDPRGSFILISDSGAESEFPIKLVTRGNNRLDECPFAPLRLDFRKTKLADTLLAGQNRLKLVTHCRNGSFAYQQAVIREYLAYRILNVLTDYSFRVRLLHIDYDYADDDNEQESSYGFFVESRKGLAARIDKERQDLASVEFSSLDREHANLISVFQYFIGNVDYSPVAGGSERCCHNSALFSDDVGHYWSIPYDFDSTGFVEALHVNISPSFRQRHIRQRVYRGRCANRDLLPGTLQQFRDQRAEIENLVESQAELSKSKRKRLLSYIEDFYLQLEDEDELIKEFSGGCAD